MSNTRYYRETAQLNAGVERKHKDAAQKKIEQYNQEHGDTMSMAKLVSGLLCMVGIGDIIVEEVVEKVRSKK
jgi:hypothetical protein